MLHTCTLSCLKDYICLFPRAPRFSSFQQQDSQELLRYLLDSMRSEEINVNHKFELTLLLKFYVIYVFKSQHLVAELVYIARLCYYDACHYISCCPKAKVLHMPKVEFNYRVLKKNHPHISLQHLVLKPPYRFLFGLWKVHENSEMLHCVYSI